MPQRIGTVKSRSGSVEEKRERFKIFASRHGMIVIDQINRSRLPALFASKDRADNIIDVNQIEESGGISSQRIVIAQGGYARQQPARSVNAGKPQDRCSFSQQARENLFCFETNPPIVTVRLTGKGFIDPFPAGLSVNADAGKVDHSIDSRFHFAEHVLQSGHINVTLRMFPTAVKTNAVKNRPGSR